MDMYEGLSLIADPVHGYIFFTSTGNTPGEVSEQDIIDTPWVQRLRYIYQLQSARWVFPSAEHSRFQHSLGTMHIAGKWARHLHPSLNEIFTDLPSINYLEELLRMAGLLHDTGHGPFGHFFDDNYLDEFGHTHESVGAEIITQKLGGLISKLRRSPAGIFSEGERLKAEYIAYLINKNSSKEAGNSEFEVPGWLNFLKPLLGGIYTADNLDYVLRDSYMCGVAIGPVDMERLIHYSCFTKDGLTIHKAGLPALTMFLNARYYLYSNVYYHRTTRAIDIHLKEIFRDTIKEICSINPTRNLDEYLNLTDWRVIESVKQWGRLRTATPKMKELAREWSNLLLRKVKWKMAYDTVLTLGGTVKGLSFISKDEFEKAIRQFLPNDKKGLQFRVDMANQDPRPLNLLTMGEKQIYVLNPITGKVSAEALREFFDFLPAKVVQCRVYALNHEDDRLLSGIAEQIMNLPNKDSHSTNV